MTLYILTIMGIFKNHTKLAFLAIALITTGIALTIVYSNDNKQTPKVDNQETQIIKPDESSENSEGESANMNENLRYSDNWLLRKSDKASVRVPDGFKFLSNQNELFDFTIPDKSPASLVYNEGVVAVNVGRPSQHFGLGLIVGYNSEGLNDRGTLIKELKTYSGLDIKVKLFEQINEPTGLDFPKGSKHLKYTITKDTNYINIDYVYSGEGIVEIIEEMAKSSNIY